jgi:hypothetical protein
MKKPGFSKKNCGSFGGKKRTTRKNKKICGGAFNLPEGVVYKTTDKTISIPLKKYPDDVEIIVTSRLEGDDEDYDAPFYLGLPRQYKLDGSEYNSIINFFKEHPKNTVYTLIINGEKICKMKYQEFLRKSSPTPKTPTIKSPTVKTLRNYRYVFNVTEILKDDNGNDMLE